MYIKPWHDGIVGVLVDMEPILWTQQAGTHKGTLINTFGLFWLVTPPTSILLRGGKYTGGSPPKHSKNVWNATQTLTIAQDPIVELQGTHTAYITTVTVSIMRKHWKRFSVVHGTGCWSWWILATQKKAEFSNKPLGAILTPLWIFMQWKMYSE